MVRTAGIECGVRRRPRTKETWTVRDDDGSVMGVTLIDRHFPRVAEMHLIVADRAVHGAGVGTAMLLAIEADALARGVQQLEVKTRCSR